MRMRAGLVLVLLSGALAAWAQTEDRFYTDDKGRIRIRPVAPDPEYTNPLPPELEEAWLDRVNIMIRTRAKKFEGIAVPGNTYGENEKQHWANALWYVLWGRKDEAIKAFTARDPQDKECHSHTLGLDFWHGYALKNHVPMHFFFGQYLPADWLERQVKAAKIWTEQDPYTREHPQFGRGSPEARKKFGDYSPQGCGHWMDLRLTDGFRGYRNGSVYLFAEASGNEDVRKKYARYILDVPRSWHHSGKGEWESTNYLGHNVVAFISPLDFAKDPEVRKAAKVTADWIWCSAALKWFHGQFGGAGLREFGGGFSAYDGDAPKTFQLGFGLKKDPDDDSEGIYDTIHLFFSHYRPPLAALKLADKDQLPLPIGYTSVKPEYGVWKGEGELPKLIFWETGFIQRHSFIGSAVHRPPVNNDWNPNLNKILLWDPNGERLRAFCVNETPPGVRKAHPKEAQVAQRRDLMLMAGSSSAGRVLHIYAPDVPSTQVGDVTVYDAGPAWLAVQWVNLALPSTRRDPPAPPRRSDFPEGKDGDAAFKAANKQFPRTDREAYLLLQDGTRTFPVTVTQDGLWVVMAQAVEAKNWKSKEEFAAALNQQWSLQADGKAVRAIGVDGGKLSLTLKENELPLVEVDGVARDFEKETAIWKVTEGAPVIDLPRGGSLTVRAGGKLFRSTVTLDGKITWENGDDKP